MNIVKEKIFYKNEKKKNSRYKCKAKNEFKQRPAQLKTLKTYS